jgi:hypothetical protein
LCRKWKAYNRIIVVQEAPEGLHKPSQTTTTATTTPANKERVAKDEESSHSGMLLQFFFEGLFWKKKNLFEGLPYLMNN